MSILELFVSAFIIGLSGAMMPGPLLTYVINSSLRRGFIAGPLLVFGHALLELTLVILMILGLSKLFANSTFTAVVGIIGGSVLFWMGYGMIKAAIKKEISIEDASPKEGKVSGLILPGAIVSASNPYWILWWATVGMTYLANASKQGIMGVSAFYFGHIFSDLIWYSFVAWIVAFGRKVLNDKMYRGLVAVFGVVLIYFAATFIIDGFRYFGFIW
ncbi:lysine transporter LysE [Anoxybacter fermentans]|uniref:Lysine transporter LysE n=1 Tax=Anoxybacter fermentans TaxID=1323375 RepID=A0A3S9SUS0_9FIRM|nr:LysE family transporter [Anoxybacter fermentans]AZR72024.1 lysine transporter LysE [Anoxybacter fermentans]